MSSSTSGFSVLDMAKSYADENDVNVEDLFKRNPVSGNIKKDTEAIESQPIASPPAKQEIKKKEWVPDESLTKGMPELSKAPVTYKADEIKADVSTKLVDMGDEAAFIASQETMNEMERKLSNIEAAKARFGISKLQVPKGPWEVRVFSAAGDTSVSRSAQALDLIFSEIINHFPEFILEWTDPEKNKTNPFYPNSESIRNVDQPQTLQFPVDRDNNIIRTTGDVDETVSSEGKDSVKVVINKTQLPTITWTDEERDRIRKSRIVHLDIVEDVSLKYNNIKDLDDNAVDVVLSQYVRKVNDVTAVLPASKYRATFTGLSYPEVIDLSYSNEINNLDGERKKWHIIYEHLNNPSIGDFADFDDFLKKTSFMDLEFMTWKVLCATAMDKEIISIDCHGNLNGHPCKRNYDWIYSPAEVLVPESVSPVVMEEMKKTGEASSMDDIEKNYKESMLMTNNTIELPSSKIGVVFGHISAYDYLNSIYAEVHKLSEEDSPQQSEALAYSTLTVIKSFLIPSQLKFQNGHPSSISNNGEVLRITGVNNLIRVIKTLNEIDWQILPELVRIMLEPYKFRFSLRNLCCPTCNTKSEIPIEDMSRMLFILARSLTLVQVTLKKA